MTFETYLQESARTVPEGEDKQRALLHCAMGIAGELGEIYKGSRLSPKEAAEELGDIAWYATHGIRNFAHGLVKQIASPQNAGVNFYPFLAGLLIDHAKRVVFYGMDINDQVVSEDCYLTLGWVKQAAQGYGYTIEQIFDINIAKLKARYPDKYSDDKALTRNIEAEQEAMNEVQSKA